MKAVVGALVTFINPPSNRTPISVILWDSSWCASNIALKFVQRQKIVFILIGCFGLVDAESECELLS